MRVEAAVVPTEGRSYRHVLRSRRLALLLAGDVVSKAGDGMVIVALPLQVLRAYRGSHPAVAVGLIAAAPYALAFVLSVLSTFRHRQPLPRRLVAIDCALRGATFISIALVALTGALQLWWLGVVLLLGSGARLLATSSRRVIATAMGDENSRFTINSLLGISDSVALYVAGPVLGGVLTMRTSPAVVLLIDGLSFVMLLSVVLIAVPSETRAPVRNASDGRTAWGVLADMPTAARLLALVFLFNLLYMPIDVALPLLVRGPLHAGPTGLGTLWTSFGAGALIGALATNMFRRLSQPRLLIGIVAGWAVCVVAVAWAPTLTVAAIAFGIGGFVYAPFTPVAYSLVQDAIGADGQQPVLNLWAAGTAVAAPIGLGLGGPFIAAVGIRDGLVVSAVLTLALSPLALGVAGRTDGPPT